MDAPETPLHLKLVDLLLDLHKKQSSGVVRLEARAARKQIVVRAGHLAFAESDQADEHLARVMADLKIIQRSDIPRIAAAMKSGKPSDEAALAACTISAQDLETGAREQALRIISSLFGWAGHQLHFYHGSAFENRLTNLHAPLPDILVQSARRAAACGCIPEGCKSPKGRVSPVAGVSGRMDVPLDRFESYALSLVADSSDLEELLPLVAESGPKPFTLFQRLMLLGLIRRDESRNGAGAPGRTPGPEALSEEVDALLQQFEVATLYEILSVPTGAQPDQIKTSYHELARRYHPDRFQSDQYPAELRARIEKLFTHITGAYVTLSDPVARIAYDEARLKQESPVESALHAKASADLEKEKMAETLFRSARAAITSGEHEKAVNQLKECVWLLPDTARYHHFLALAQSEIPKYRKEAEAHYLKSIDLDSSAVESRLALGKLYMKVNLPRRAEAQFQEVLNWDATNPEALKLIEIVKIP